MHFRGAMHQNVSLWNNNNKKKSDLKSNRSAEVRNIVDAPGDLRRIVLYLY